MSRYEIVYSEIKVKKFNKISTMRKFVFKNNSPVHGVLRITENKDKMLYALDLLNWHKEKQSLLSALENKR